MRAGYKRVQIRSSVEYSSSGIALQRRYSRAGVWQQNVHWPSRRDSPDWCYLETMRQFHDAGKGKPMTLVIWCRSVFASHIGGIYRTIGKRDLIVVRIIKRL